MSAPSEPVAIPEQVDVASQITELERELVATRGQLRQVLATLDAARAQYREVLSSTSWRITAPLRALKLFLNRIAVDGRRPAHAPTPQFVQVNDRPTVPRALFNVAIDTDLEPNRTYRLVDARDAMAPLKRVSTAGTRQPRIALLGGTELVNELSNDADVMTLARNSWQDLLQLGKFDYLMVEPVWNLSDPGWGYCMVHDGNDRTELLEVFARCRMLSMPIVLWVREDPENYERFAWLGEQADRIYAVDERLVTKYRSDCNGKQVSLLPLAIQPALHNPIRSYALFESATEFGDKVLYDGWYDLLGRADHHGLVARMGGVDLRVCESEWEFGSARIGDADGLQNRILGCANTVDKIALDKLFGAEVFLSGGLRSEWRKRQAMLRAVACGSLALAEGDGSGSGAALPEGVVRWLGDEPVGPVVQWARENELQRERMLHALRRRLMKEHTYAQRLSQISEDLGMAHVSGGEMAPRISAILVTKRPQLLAGCIERFRQDRYPERELVVIMHGKHDLDAARRLVRSGEPIHIYGMNANHSLGACLNFAIRQTDSPYWCKMDDDDFYGPSYLEDIMLARKMVDFDVAGKAPVFTYMQQQETLFWDPAWRRHANLLYTAADTRSALIAGATILARRDAIDGITFSERRRAGADSQFIGDCLNGGARVLSADAFGFVRYRGGAEGGHTWRMDESSFVRGAKPLGGFDAIGKTAFV